MVKFYSQAAGTDPDSIDYLFTKTYGFKQVGHPADADILVWNGGADISPSIYGEEPIPGSGPKHMSQRDHREVDLFNEYKTSGKLLLGICRGSQLLNCLNGGKLYQHVDGHGRDHMMLDTRTGELVHVTSTHHQQMRPSVDGELIGLASCSTFKYTDHGRVLYQPCAAEALQQLGRDAEIVWYQDTHTLCIQGHPEYVPGSRFAAYTLELINQCRAA